MSEGIRLLLADDHALFRKGLEEILKEHADFDIVGTAGDAAEAITKAENLEPDVILMDIHMPAGGGVRAVRTLKKNMDISILMLTVSKNDDDLMAAIDAGADGYLLKNAEPAELYRAIRDVIEGRGALSPEVTRAVMQRAASPTPAPAVSLTPRETEVLQLISEGKTTAEIALELAIAASTVKTHARNIMDKLEAANRTEAVARAIQLGLLKTS